MPKIVSKPHSLMHSRQNLHNKEEEKTLQRAPVWYQPKTLRKLTFTTLEYQNWSKLCVPWGRLDSNESHVCVLCCIYLFIFLSAVAGDSGYFSWTVAALFLLFITFFISVDHSTVHGSTNITFQQLFH